MLTAILRGGGFGVRVWRDRTAGPEPVGATVHTSNSLFLIMIRCHQMGLGACVIQSLCQYNVSADSAAQ